MASSALSLSFSHSHSVVGVSSLSTSATSTSSAPSLSYCGRGHNKIVEGKRFNHSFGNVQNSGFSIKSLVPTFDHVSTPLFLIKSRQTIRLNRRHSHLLVAESDRVITDRGESSISESVSASEESSLKPNQLETSVANDSNQENKIPVSSSIDDSKRGMQKKAPLTARERLRAARVLSRYSDSKPAKSDIGRSVLDALRESEKGKKGLPQAPTNLFDDSKRGMPKKGLTFDFPGGSDLFVIAFSFVFISTVMFATTYFVWKVGAIHFNEL
ncbi:uncharacterized protein LOC104903165 isoform X1 [Beta vulgaris subsp. vulgaris]|uniref:uncharacterized protein LOC104903165 isoform X1 n=1 Tax=Beta vulgaris subsp. vulgaris TaxID=3555 RepID=UPI002036A2C0|nr:uncharacterized protein LOC104903165 isoform X1 [Beta vulgaris subsp. vulgaris]